MFFYPSFLIILCQCLSHRKFREKDDDDDYYYLKIYRKVETSSRSWSSCITFCLRAKYHLFLYHSSDKRYGLSAGFYFAYTHMQYFTYNVYFPWKSPKILNIREVFSAPEVPKINICMLYCVEFCTSSEQTICYV